MTGERAIIKLGLRTGAHSSHGKSVQAPIRLVILHSVYNYPGRLATATERTASVCVNKDINADCGKLLPWKLQGNIPRNTNEIRGLAPKEIG